MTTTSASDKIDIYYDPNWDHLQPVAEEYDTYLKGTYEQHRQDNLKGWELHEANMNRRVVQGIEEISSATGKSVEDLSILIIGPGMHPVDREFQEETMSQLRKVKRIVVGDICPEVTNHATRNLVANGVESSRILQAQLDVTNGRSISYDRKIDEALEGVTTLGGLLQAIISLNAVPIEKLLESKEIAVHGWQIGEAKKGGTHMRGGHNVFTHKGKLIRIDGIFYQMVMAGIGAAAEAKIWNCLYACLKREGDLCTTDTERNTLSTFATNVRTNLHQLISNFHTHSAILTLRDSIQNALQADSPPPVQITINDTDTELMHDKTHPIQGGILPRIRMHEVAEKLRQGSEDQEELTVTVEHVGPWADEVVDSLRAPHIPGHQHPNVLATTIVPESLFNR